MMGKWRSIIAKQRHVFIWCQVQGILLGYHLKTWIKHPWIKMTSWRKYSKLIIDEEFTQGCKKQDDCVKKHGYVVAGEECKWDCDPVSLESSREPHVALNTTRKTWEGESCKSLLESLLILICLITLLPQRKAAKVGLAERPVAKKTQLESKIKSFLKILFRPCLSFGISHYVLGYSVNLVLPVEGDIGMIKPTLLCSREGNQSLERESHLGNVTELLSSRAKTRRNATLNPPSAAHCSMPHHHHPVCQLLLYFCLKVPPLHITFLATWHNIFCLN